jgi:flagellar biosynthesis anti-sigma factor FlgM
MKVNPNAPSLPVQPSGGSSTSRSSRSSAKAETRVSLSGDATFVSSVRAEAAGTPSVREDVVARVKQAIQNGTFESEVDFDRVLDGLTADL